MTELVVAWTDRPHIAAPTAPKLEPPCSEMCPPGPVFGLWVSTDIHAVPVCVGATGLGLGATAADVAVGAELPTKGDGVCAAVSGG